MTEETKTLIAEAEADSLLSGVMLREYRKLDLDLLKLESSVLERRARPTMVQYKLKRQLWKMIHAANKTGEPIAPVDVYSTICSYGCFAGVIQTPDKFAWMLQPIHSYEKEMDALLDKATSRYEELLSIDITVQKKVINADGEEELVKRVDVNRAKALLSVIKNVEDRAKGLALQKKLNIHTVKPEGEIEQINTEQVEQRIAELEAKLGKGNTDGEPIEAEVVTVKESNDGENK